MLKYCPVTGVYLPRFLLSVVAGFAFFFLYEMVVHGHLLSNLYAQTPTLWRTPEDMNRHFGFVLFSQLALVAISALIFTRHYEARGVGEGVRFGVLLGVLMGIMMASSYAYMPISGALAFAWFLTGFVQGLVLGVIFSLTYRRG